MSMIPVRFQILERMQETADTFTLTMRHADPQIDMRHLYDSSRPGQFNMLFLPGVGEVPISISAIPPSRDGIVHTIRSVGIVTSRIEKLKAGDTIGLRGPFGTAWPLEAARGRDVIVIAGGIGLAPLRPVVHELIKNRSQYEKVLLLYGTRTPSDMLFREELLEWLGRFDIDVTVTVDRAESEWKGNVGVVPPQQRGSDRRSENRWKGHVGVVPRFIETADFDASKATAMICGPEVMMNFSIRALHGRGMSDDNIYLSMERSMKCGEGLCGHCLYGPHFVCKNGPVFSFSQIRSQFGIKEL